MIAADGLTKFYGDKCAIRDLSFQIDTGEIVGILGLNGAGKTTTLKILSCLLLPSAGSVRIQGRDIVENPHETRKLVGFLPDTPPVYDEMSVESYLAFAGELRGLSRGTAKQRTHEVLEVTQALDVRTEIIGNLSHGYRQRVAIAQAVIHDPPLLILDEPISGLDPAQIKEMREMVRGFKGQHTVLLSSHILSEISQTCDRILVVHDGRLVASGSEEELVSKSGAQKLRVTVRGAQAAIADCIKGVEGVVGCKGTSQPQQVPEVIDLEVQCEKDVREELARSLVQGGFGLLQLAAAEAELESTFLQLTHSAPETAPESRPSA